MAPLRAPVLLLLLATAGGGQGSPEEANTSTAPGAAGDGGSLPEIEASEKLGYLPVPSADHDAVPAGVERKEKGAESASGGNQHRRKIMRKRMRVVGHVSAAEKEDNDEVQTVETLTPDNTKANTKARQRAVTASASDGKKIKSSLQGPVRRRVIKRTKNAPSSSSQSKRPAGASSRSRQIIRRRGPSLSSKDKSSAITSTTAPNGSSPNSSKTPIKRRRIVGGRKDHSAAAHPTSSPSQKRRGRRPLGSVSALVASSPEVPSVQPLLVRPRVARADGSTGASSVIPLKRKVIRRRGRVLSDADSRTGSSGSKQNNGAAAASPTVIRRRVRVRNPDKSSTPGISRKVVTSSSTGGPPSPRTNGKARGKACRRPTEEATTLVDFSSDGASPVRPLDVRPRIARARGASGGPGGINTIGSSSDKSPFRQVTRRRVIKRRGGQKAVKVVTPITSRQITSATVAPDPAETSTEFQQPTTTTPFEVSSTTDAPLPSASATPSPSPDTKPASLQTAATSESPAVTAEAQPEDSITSWPAVAVATPQPATKERNRNGRGRRPAKLSRKVIRKRLPSVIADKAVTIPSITKVSPDAFAVSRKEPKVVATTQKPFGVAERTTDDNLPRDDLQRTVEAPAAFPRKPKPGSEPDTVSQQPSAEVPSAAVQDILAPGFSRIQAIQPSPEQIRGRRYQAISRQSSPSPTTSTPSPVTPSRDAFRPELRTRKTATKSYIPRPPPSQVDKSNRQSSGQHLQPATNSFQQPLEGGAGSDTVGDLQSTLPAGGGTVVGDRSVTQFSCDGRPYGYYADMETGCQVFHICTPVLQTNGAQQMLKHSFFCNNGTVFDQRTLSCRVTPAAMPCDQSEQHYASVDFFTSYNYFDRLRQDQEQRDRQTGQQQRLDTLQDLERLEAQLA
ncbi:flocculation protein FLO11-like [Amphibalanus amphitrite]|uniref:flocculation protein FLO11-like n=1 Tax=Amphibalanus amphitrite TaxID=1232801 RepID=UPI001C903ADE|nr:flocculation protein FLO11-like [Amphibalanus amphitrite]